MLSPAPRAGGKFATLELIRLVAALWVVVHHVCILSGNRPFVKFFQLTGRVPVVVFFVLSGFVIGLRHVGRREPFADFLRARTIRIYPIFLVAIALAGLIYMVRLHYLPPDRIEANIVGWPVFFGNLLMVQGPWWWGVKGCVPPFGGAVPLWTLSFEWWFYIAFWLINRSVPEPAQRLLVFSLGFLGSLALIGAPYYAFLWLALFTIWWAGLELAKEWRATEKLTWLRQWPSLAAMACITLAPLAVGKLAGHIPLRLEGLAAARDTFEKSVGEGFVVVLITVLLQKSLLSSREGQDSIKLKLGAVSYAVYAVHMPMVALICDWVHPSFLARAVASLSAAMVLGWIVEFGFQPLASQAIKRVWAPVRKASALPV